MLGAWNCLGFFLTLLQLSYQVANHDSSSYIAAVVEYSPILKWHNGSATLKANTDAYIEFIEKASDQYADIIVFPEYGLTSLSIPRKRPIDSSWTTVVPSAAEEYVPCTGNRSDVSETLKKLSCAARRSRIYVVANIAEKDSCGPADQQECSLRNDCYYNTNVVFDRKGKIIARYRKVNLYMESRFDKPLSPEAVTFDTDFGVKFGTFICFDILFSVPALNLTRIEGISDIVFPTAWLSETPFLTGATAQTQFGWSSGEKVNLLAAEYHGLSDASTGSGIYLGGERKIATTYVSFDNKSRLLIARVPKIVNTQKREDGLTAVTEKQQPPRREENGIGRGGGNAISNEKTFLDYVLFHLLHDNVTQFTTVSLNGSSTAGSTSICLDGLCCNFDVQTALVDPKIRYRFAGFNGVRLYGTEITAGVRFCSLIQCSDDTIMSCGSVQPSNTTFTSLKVTATLDDYSANFLRMPSILNSSLLPFQDWAYSESSVGNQTNLTLALDEPMNNIVTFGIYVRDFSRDQWHDSADT